MNLTSATNLYRDEPDQLDEPEQRDEEDNRSHHNDLMNPINVPKYMNGQFDYPYQHNKP